MLTIALRILAFAAIVYVGLAAIIYFQQNKFIFPAPQRLHAPASGYEAVSLETEDGLTLIAHWRAPEAGAPTVVHFHGNGGSLLGSSAENAMFEAEGYGALLVEYRGYGGNLGDPSEEGFQRDGRASMAFLAAQGVSPDRLIIKGHSIGTGTAVNMALEHDAAALILVAPFTSVPDLTSAMMPIFPMRALIRSPFDNVGKAPKLDLPVLIQHGSADTVIPEAYGEALHAAIAGSTYQRIEGAGHELTVDPAVQAKQLAWLAKLGL
ncbi:MAG: alpha/beta hydrolase [Pseudomonadota bacterium]